MAITGLSALLGGFAGLISLVAFLPYIDAILKKKAKPNKATWWIWSLVSIALAASSYFATGSINTLWLPIGLAIGNLAVAALSLRYGEGKASKLDAASVACAIIGLMLWVILGSPLLALAIIIIVDFIGAVPTIVKTYKAPESEELVTWSLFLIADIFSLLSAQRLDIAVLALPLHFAITHAIMVYLIISKKKRAP